LPTPAPPDLQGASEPDFATVLETCRQFLLAIAAAELPDRLMAKGGASDIVQDTLTAAVRCRCQFRGHTLADLRAWLRGILLNELAVFRRRYLATLGRDVNRERPIEGVDPAELPAGAASPSAALERTERARAVAAALLQLPAEYREAVVLRLEFGLGFREIGERLGRSEEAARKLFTRALEKLRDTFPDTAS
jgi:RNA polymerase sigma-70 factor (ECF subfamily)